MAKTYKKKFIFCKRNFKFGNGIIFEAGETYYYYEYKNYTDPDIFVYYNERSTDVSRKGYRFYFKLEECDTINSLVYDYFCNPVEERKIKLQRLYEKG